MFATSLHRCEFCIHRYDDYGCGDTGSCRRFPPARIGKKWKYPKVSRCAGFCAEYALDEEPVKEQYERLDQETKSLREAMRLRDIFPRTE